MSLYVLDTDTLSLLQEGHAAVVARVAACSPEDLAITVMSVEEQLSGWYRCLRQAKKPDELARVYDRLTDAVSSLARLPILSFSEAAIHRSNALQAAAKIG
jgi:tRNA(fMet)-specific endonuclease VapC